MRWTRQLRWLDWLVARPIAHRGLHDANSGRIENTASAFAAAIAGNYAIECDLQSTRDREAVVFHDHTLSRLMDATGQVRSFDAKQLRAMDFKTGNDRIPSLGELIDQVAGRVPLVIELKSQWDDDETLANRALAVLEPYAGPYCLMSFDPHLMAAIRARSPRTVRGMVADRATDAFYSALPLARRLELRHLSHMERTAPDFLSYHHGDLPFAPVGRLRAAGVPIISWTIRSPAAAADARRYSDQITFEGFAAR